MHELEIVNGVAQHVYVGEVPWHGLGKQIPADLSPDQVLVAAGLDWNVIKTPLTTTTPDGTEVLINGKAALLRDRDNAVLDVIGNDWEPLQNADAFNFFDDLVREGNMQMHTAGSLKGGRIVWALAKISESFNVKGMDDRVDSYLLLSNPHMYGRSIDVRFTPIRVVCNNTLTMALNKESKNAVRISHKRRFNADQVKEMLGIASFKLSKYKEAADFLASKRFDLQSLLKFYGTVFPSAETTRKIKAGERLDLDDLTRSGEECMELLDTQPGAEFARGSWWQAFNSVTYMLDHIAGRSADTRLQSAWYGANQQKKLAAINTALELAKIAA